MFWSNFIPCADCGEAIPRGSTISHTCDPSLRVEFQMAALRHRLDMFDSDLETYLATNEGRFEVWLAAREIRRSQAA